MAKHWGIFFMSILLSTHCFASINIQHWETKDGARVYFVENHDIPMVDLELTFNAGNVFCPPDKPGLANVTRTTMRRGADGLDEDEIINQLAEVGARLGSSSGSDSASFYLRTTTDEHRKAQSLRVLKQILHQPDFPMTVYKSKIERYLEGVKESNIKPGNIAYRAYRKAIYGQHPYRKSELLSKTGLNKITRQDMVDFYQKHYLPNNAVIAIVGDLTLNEAKTIAGELSYGLPKGEVPKIKVAENTMPQGMEKRIKHSAHQAHIYMGSPSVKRDHPDRLPLLLGNYILGGGGFESRLTQKLRQEEGLVYGVSSEFEMLKHGGDFTVNFKTKKEQEDKALALTRNVIGDFIENGVTEKELQEAKATITGSFPFKTDSNSKIIGYLSLIGFHRLPLTYLDNYNESIEAITVEQINTAFKNHLDLNKFVTVVVGKGSPEINSVEGGFVSTSLKL